MSSLNFQIMKKREIIILILVLGTIFGLFFVTNQILIREFKWWTIPLLIIVWVAVIMGGFGLFDVMTSKDDSKGEEDRRID